MKTLRYLVVVMIGFGLLDCRSTATSRDENSMEGWHFHVCSNETKAGRIWFELSGNGDNSTYERQEIKWHSGQESMISVPKDMRFIDEMNLSIRTGGKRKAKICVLYGEYVIKSIEVTGTETNKLTRQNRDTCPC
jgi:hypothetical protein